jgi:aminocarboxymuconate-semialdehyde decarboxylase
MVVDVHGHVAYPALGERYPLPPALLDIDGVIEQKAAAGIDLTIVGSPTGSETFMAVPGVDPFAQPLDELRRHHAWLAEIVAEHPGRLAAYAWVNPFGGDEMLAAVADDVRQGGHVGLIVNSSVEGRYLDDSGADEFFAMAAELAIPIFLHPPTRPVGADSVSDGRLVEQVVRFVEITTALAALIFAGRLERHPELKILAATGGGALGIVGGRLEGAFRQTGPPGGAGPPWMRFENKISEPPSAYLRNVYVDTANLNAHHQLANIDLLGAGHLLYGSDSPPSPIPFEVSLGNVRGLPIEEGEKAGILGGNAAELFGLD